MRRFVLTLVALFLFSACGGGGNGEVYEPPEEVLGFATDAARVVALIEETHPIFLMPEMLPDAYEAARANLLAIGNDASRQDFVFAVRRYFSQLQDGHMGGVGSLRYPHDNPIFNNYFLQADWEARFQDGRFDLFMKDTGERVIQVGGVAIDEIFAIIDKYFYAENSADQLRSYANFARYGTILELVGADLNQLYITTDGGTKINKELSADWRQVFLPPQHDFIIRHEMMGDVFFIDLRSFNDGDHITEAVVAIEEAMHDGVTKFIIDLRGNTGGSSLVGQRLLEAMGLTLPDFGVIRRISPLLAKLRPWFADSGVEYTRHEPNIELSANPKNVFVSVLTDTNSYSASIMFGVWVQDGEFGNIVGRPSRNNPTLFGDMLNYTLPYSNITLQISHALFLRPDANADQFYLWPDILTDPADALDVALEFLATI